MPEATRKEFTDAVICLQNTAPQRLTTDEESTYPGVKSRYDEYVATHIKYTYNIHLTADFLAWHRYFIWLFEHDLQTLCGYTGSLPYWNWALDASAPQDSPLFTGDAYSMGSNGAYIASRSGVYLGNQNVVIPPGTGGGCITSGPFSNYTANLGPLDTTDLGDFDYNPHCVTRDLNSWVSTRFTSWENVTTLLLNNNYVEAFQGVMQADSNYLPTGNFGVHGGGHFTLGSQSTMSDFESSPADPVFYLHHGMIDRLWTVWQGLDLPGRQNAISGTSTLANSPASADMTLDDMLPFGLVADDVRFGGVMDTLSGQFCYYYV